MSLFSFLQKSWSKPLFRVAMLIFSVSIVTSHFSATNALAAQAALSWSAPINADGTPVTNLKGYKVHVGTTPGSYSQHLDVGNVTSYTLTSLAEGTTYYTAVSDYDTNGAESGYSNEVSKNFPAAAATYTITANAGSGGAVTAVNNTKINTASNGTTTITSVSVASGTSQSFTVTPSAGYSIAGVTVDGASVGAVSSYAFSNVTANHTITASFASSTGTTPPSPTPTPTAVVAAVNAGGAAYKDSTGVSYAADGKYTGGTAATAASTVAISGTTDSALYQSERYGNFTYNLPVANGTYNVTLKFAEIYWTAAGQRVFSVAIGGKTVVSNLDIFAKVGKNAAYDVVVPATVTNGVLSISFTSQVNNAKVSAIKVAPATSATTPTASQVVFSTNGGGAQYTDSTGVSYAADSKYTGGTAATADATVAFTGTADQVLYRSERYGNFSYSIPVANGNYSVTLKFAEIYWTAAGKRVFSVNVGGQALNDLDNFAKVGKNAAYDVVVPVTVTNGVLNINFVSKVDNAKVSAILIKTM